MPDKDNPSEKVSNGKYLYLGLLPTFYSDIKKIDLGDFSIEKIPWNSIKEFFIDIDITKFIENESITEPYFFVFGELSKCPERKYPVGQTVVEGGKKLFLIGPIEFYLDGLDQFKKPVLLLNLFKDSYEPAFVSIGLFRWILESQEYLAKYLSSNLITERKLGYDENGNQYIGGQYGLKDEEIKALINFKTNIYSLLFKDKSASNEKYFQIAMEYYWEGCLKEINDEELAVLDFIIALEALYLEDEAELRYKFSNRVAILLGDPGVDQKGLQEYAYDIYGLRNNIVHGALTKGDIDKKLRGVGGKGLAYKEFGEERLSIRELFRQSLVYFLSLHLNGLDKKGILINLDSALFDKSVREKVMMMKKRLAFR